MFITPHQTNLECKIKIFNQMEIVKNKFHQTYLTCILEFWKYIYINITTVIFKK
jgi:hypothetical protein